MRAKIEELRADLMRVACKNNKGHIAPSLSCLEILALIEPLQAENKKLKQKAEKLVGALDNANECIKVGLSFGWKTIEWEKCIEFSELALAEFKEGKKS